MAVSQAFLIFDDLVVRGTGKVDSRVFLYWNLCFLLITKQRLGIWGKKITEVKFHFYHVISKIHKVNMIYHC